MKPQALVEPRSVSMYGNDWATVDAYAKDMGYPSTSAALRRIIDEWRTFKGAQLPLMLTDEKVSYEVST